MSRLNAIFLILILFLLYQNCYIPEKEFRHDQPILSPKGENITVHDDKRVMRKGEFLFFDETDLYLMNADNDRSNSVISIPIETITHISVDSIVNRNWKIHVLGFQLIPALVLGGTLAVYNEDLSSGLVLAGAAAIPGLLSYAAFAASQPEKPKLEGNMTPSKLKKILKYARYPYMLNPEQKNRILEYLNKKSQ